MCNLSWVKSLLLLLLCCSVILNAGAQSPGFGKLTGKITDSTTRQSLLGVSIVPKGTNKGVTSINDGSYILTIPPGKYTIRYSYSGFASKEITEIVIRKGETSFLDIVLAPKSALLGDVVVTASIRREAQSAVYNRQKISSAASDGISQELISKTPDIDAGQVLKRVTGVSVQNDKFVVVRGLSAQYNQTMLNGVAMTSTETNQNAFSFDLVPAAVVDNIVVNKTATPDMPGNFAGGVVQVNTKDFPSKDFISVAVQAGFSDQTYNKNFYSDKRGDLEILGFGGKIRDLPTSFPRTSDRVNLTSLNAQERIRALKTLNNNLTPVNQGPSGLNENIQLGFGKTIKGENNNQFGIVAALTQRKSELIEQETSIRQSSLGAGDIIFGYVSENTRYKYSSELAGVLNLAYSFGNNKITFKNLYSQVFRNTYIQRDSVFAASFDVPQQGVKGFSYQTEQRSLLNSVLAGEHKTGRNKETQLDWNINVTLNNSEFPDTRNFLMSFVENDKKLRLYSINTKGTRLIENLAASSRLWSETNDLVTGGAFNLTSVFNLFNSKQIIKGGLLFQNRRREATGTALPYDNIIMASIDSVLSPERYYLGGMDIATGSVGFVEGAGNYNASTSLQAGYESIESKIGKSVRVIWGIRFENYQQSINIYTPLYNPNFQAPEYVPQRFASNSTFSFLPSVNIIYSPFKSVNVRGAFSKTVIRPDLKDLAPFSRYDFQSFQLTTGNADLKSTSVSNYDLKLEWFPSSGEIVSFAAFYKKMIDPIEYAQTNQTNIDVGSIAINSGEATVKGLELEFRKKLNFITGAEWMQNITLFANGSLLNSSVNERIITNLFYDFSPEHRLTGQPDYIVNGGISISAFKNSFEATCTFNRTGDYINQLGNSIYGINPFTGKEIQTVPNFVVQARNILDLGVRQSLLKRKAQIKFNVSNLLGKPLIIYQDFNGNEKLDTPFVIDANFQAPVPGKVLRGDDNIASITNGQRTYYLSFSYTF